MPAGIEANETIGARGRRVTQALEGRPLARPPRPLVADTSRRSPPAAEEGTETGRTIGERASARQFPHAPQHAQLVDAHRHDSRRTKMSPTDSQLSRQSSNEYVPRHSKEYILAQGETPRVIQPLPPAPPRLFESIPESRSAMPASDTSLPKRTPGDALKAELGEIPSLSTPQVNHPAVRTGHRIPARSAEENSQVVTNPDPVGTTQQTLLRSATEKGIHARKKPRKPRRFLAAATAAVVLGVALAGTGFALLKDRKTTPLPADRKSSELLVQNLPPTLEPESPILIQLTETGVISNKDGNQWNASATRTLEALDHRSTPVTNIVAKVGAYDSRITSPDPDAAQAGDAFTTLSESAIEVVDRLQQPPGPDASEAEQEAARLIHRLNSLSPMETKTFIEHYGSDIEALKQHLTTILTPQQEDKTSSLTPTQFELTSPDHSSGGQADKAQETTIFSRILDKTTHLFKRDPQTKGRKAIAALAKERDRRQKQPSLA